MKKCVILEAEGARQRGRPRKTWKEVVENDMNDLQLRPVMLRIMVNGGKMIRQN